MVNVNSKSNPDLFQALKGGSNNFGIVTRFDMYTVAEESFWGGGINWADAKTPGYMQAVSNFAKNIKNDPNGSLIATLNYNTSIGVGLASAFLHYTKPQEQPKVYSEFFQLGKPIQATLRLDTHSKFADELDQPRNRR